LDYIVRGRAPMVGPNPRVLFSDLSSLLLHFDNHVIGMTGEQRL
jgi:hypothetical protein